MKNRFVLSIVLLFLAACETTRIIEGPTIADVPPSITSRVGFNIISESVIPNALVMRVSWATPTSDGRGDPEYYLHTMTANKTLAGLPNRKRVNGLMDTVTILRPGILDTVILTSSVWSVRRGLESNTPALGRLVIMTADGPPAPPDTVFVDTLILLPPPTPPSRSYFVAPNGGTPPAADGSWERPWSLATALGAPPQVEPGDTIWLRGGQYIGDVWSNLSGTADQPIVVRQWPGERATVDGRFDIRGRHTWYWGFEVMYSDPRRTTSLPGSDPADLPREAKTVFVLAPFTKLIHLTIHDMGDGVFAGSPAEGMEIYGCVIYNNGWDAPDRGHGHGLYLQNSGAPKIVRDNIISNSFASGIQIYGSSAATLRNFVIEGNTIFQNGAPVFARHGYSWNLHHQGAAGKLGDSHYEQNNFYHLGGLVETLRFNSIGDPPGQNLSFVRNTVFGRTQFNDWVGYRVEDNTFTTGASVLSGGNVLMGLSMRSDQPFSDHIFARNRYVTPPSTRQPFWIRTPSVGTIHSFTTWQETTGYDASGTFVSGQLTGTDVILRRSSYETNRAHLTIWNWDGAGSVPVDFSTVLQPGHQYEVFDARAPLGPPVATGVFSGAPVLIPLTVAQPEQPLGYITPFPQLTTEFGSFVVFWQ